MKKIMMFTAPWCSGCKTLKPILEKVKSKVEVELIDVEENPAAAEEYGITNLPTLFFVHDDGGPDGPHLVNHRTGASDATVKEIYRFIEE